MNIKAEKFIAYMNQQMPNAFSVTELPDDNNVPEEQRMSTVIFQGSMEAQGQNLPLNLFIDKSIFVMFQIRLAMAVVNEKNRTAIVEHLNKLNEQYKVFKYYVDEDCSIVLESVIPTTDDGFSPELLHVIIANLVYPHLQEEYKNIMKLVWSN